MVLVVFNMWRNVWDDKIVALANVFLLREAWDEHCLYVCTCKKIYCGCLWCMVTWHVWYSNTPVPLIHPSLQGRPKQYTRTFVFLIHPSLRRHNTGASKTIYTLLLSSFQCHQSIRHVYELLIYTWYISTSIIVFVYESVVLFVILIVLTRT